MAIFGTSGSDVKVVKADEAEIKFPGSDGIALGVNIQFSRNVQRVPTIGKKDVLSVSKPQGTLTAQTCLLGSLPSIFKDKGCSANETVTVSLTNDTCGNSGKTITLKHVVASALSIEMQGGRGYIVSGLSMTFTEMDM